MLGFSNMTHHCYRKLIYKSHFIFKLQAGNHCLLGEIGFPSLATPGIAFPNLALVRSETGKWSHRRTKKGCGGRGGAVSCLSWLHAFAGLVQFRPLCSLAPVYPVSLSEIVVLRTSYLLSNALVCFVSVTLTRQQHGRTPGRPCSPRWMSQPLPVHQCSRTWWTQPQVSETAIRPHRGVPAHW